MKILWVSSRIFDDREETQSGVWLKAMAMKLVSHPDLTLGNVSCQKEILDVISCDYNKIRQWAFPCEKNGSKGYPSRATEMRFEKVVNDFRPDIIQVWGSENPFKLMPFDSKLSGVKVLTMQGVLSSMGPNCLRGMSIKEMLSTIGVQEIITGRSIFSIAKSFFYDGKIEGEMIKKSNFIISQSDWTDSQIRPVNPNAKLYRTHRVLRENFLNCDKWSAFIHEEPIVYSAAVGYSLKGLHILIKAMALVKEKYPSVVLRLAGAVGRSDFLGDGYYRMILRMIKRLHLENNVIWLGAITASEIVCNLQQASIFVNPSYVESYSLAFSEAMSVGTPSVVSFAGAMPELAVNNKEALFFTPGDYKRCAYLIIKLLSDNELSKKISLNALKRSVERNVEFDIVQEQIEIYKNILNKA